MCYPLGISTHAQLESHGFYMCEWTTVCTVDVHTLSGPTPNLLGIWPQSPRKDPAVYNEGSEASPLTSHIKHFHSPQLRADCEWWASYLRRITSAQQQTLNEAMLPYKLQPFPGKGQLPLNSSFSCLKMRSHRERDLLCFCQVTVGTLKKCTRGSWRGHASQCAGSWDEQPAPLLRGLLTMRNHPSLTLGFCHVSRGRGANTGVCAVCNAAGHGNPVTTLNIHPGSLVWMEDVQPVGSFGW